MASNRRKKVFDTDFENYNEVAELVQAILAAIYENLHVLEDERQLPQKFVPGFLAYSIAVVFGNMLDLARHHQYLSTAILARSIIECFANIGWLHQAHQDVEQLGSRAKLFSDQLYKFYDFTSGRTDQTPPLDRRTLGTITERIKQLGEMWPMHYSYLSSFAHVDLGYGLHYTLGEAPAIRNMCLLIANTAALEAAKMLLDFNIMHNEHKQ